MKKIISFSVFVFVLLVSLSFSQEASAKNPKLNDKMIKAKAVCYLEQWP